MKTLTISKKKRTKLSGLWPICNLQKGGYAAMNSNASALRVWKAILSNDIGEVRRGIESGVSVNWKNEDEMDRTFLHLAASEGRIQVMKVGWVFL